MENEGQINREKVELFKKQDLIYFFKDDKILYKLAGENVWFLLDYDANTLLRKRPDGVEEIASVDFYEMEGEPFSVEFGQFKEGFMVAKFVCEKDGKQVEQFYEISPSGFTYKSQVPEIYHNKGVDWRVIKCPSPKDFIFKHVSCFKSKERLDFLFDVVNCKNIEEREEIFKHKSKNRSYKQQETINDILVEKMVDRYFDVLECLKRKQQKQEIESQENQNKSE